MRKKWGKAGRKVEKRKVKKEMSYIEEEMEKKSDIVKLKFYNSVIEKK
jgi:hypothetical protein